MVARALQRIGTWAAKPAGTITSIVLAGSKPAREKQHDEDDQDDPEDTDALGAGACAGQLPHVFVIALVVAACCPHVSTMTQSRENSQTDRDNNAAAIARWDDEGGASKSVPNNESLPSKTDRSTASRPAGTVGTPVPRTMKDLAAEHGVALEDLVRAPL